MQLRSRSSPPAAKNFPPRGTTRTRITGPYSTLAIVLAFAMLGCNLDKVINVQAPDRIVGDTFEKPGNALTLMAGAVGDFECAYGAYVFETGVSSDEIAVTDGLQAQEAYDKRIFEPTGLRAAYANATCIVTDFESTLGIYRPLSAARWQTDNLLKLLQGWTDAEVPDRTLLIAKAAAYAGYSYLLLGESMCAASFDLSAPKTPTDMFNLADDRFTTAITAAQSIGNSEFLNMALVGRARARLDLGRKAEASIDAQAVPSGFVKNAGFSAASSRRYNFLFSQQTDGGTLYTIEGPFQNYQHQGVTDPRVMVVNTGRVSPGVNIPVWYQTKYPARTSPIPIARYAEAQLIIAEADVAAGDLPGAVAIINGLHTAAGIPPFASTDPAVIMAHIIDERAAELFIEGHRFGDINRYNLPLNPAAGAPYHKGGVYGDERCYPYPGIESDNNPNG